ncbi:co-chaperone GroES [Streptococcus ovuberis]|uniref:Co-chaperonin GroES n=1 Tax=Streptococcus ovuberis TaxID=1936207 RepID=A0A7X6MZZ4_9STRE|nr:co-chaperone GroES [Streptococcus ovuberis]NKZ20976.1 co-chaperone GroES [Streptococcus ovuberis]
MLKPLGDRLIVRVAKEEEQTVGGFVLAGASKEATKTAEVLAVGEGIRTLTGELIAPSVAVGQTILVDKSAGIDIKHEGEEFVIIREADVLAIVS